MPDDDVTPVGDETGESGSGSGSAAANLSQMCDIKIPMCINGENYLVNPCELPKVSDTELGELGENAIKLLACVNGKLVTISDGGSKEEESEEVSITNTNGSSNLRGILGSACIQYTTSVNPTVIYTKNAREQLLSTHSFGSSIVKGAAVPYSPNDNDPWISSGYIDLPNPFPKNAEIEVSLSVGLLMEFGNEPFVFVGKLSTKDTEEYSDFLGTKATEFRITSPGPTGKPGMWGNLNNYTWTNAIDKVRFKVAANESSKLWLHLWLVTNASGYYNVHYRGSVTAKFYSKSRG